MAVNKNRTLKARCISDLRGELCVNKIGGREFNVIFTKAGAYRAGDYHSAEQYSIILRGKVKITLRRNNKDVTRKYGPNELIIIPPNIPHLYKFLTDAVIIEWLAGSYKPRYYKPYREIVERQLK
ncbi:MAG: hypothetical protein PHS62_04525 [Patescibacteria group bacterium]|nr:hypothetical protein [Patescibacteria group bacterium]